MFVWFTAELRTLNWDSKSGGERRFDIRCVCAANDDSNTLLFSHAIIKDSNFKAIYYRLHRTDQPDQPLAVKWDEFAVDATLPLERSPYETGYKYTIQPDPRATDSYFVADSESIHHLSMASGNGGSAKLVPIAGQRGKSRFNDGAGVDAQFDSITDIKFRHQTNKLYVCDYGCRRVRVIDLNTPTNTVSTLAGNGQFGQFGDGVTIHPYRCVLHPPSSAAATATGAGVKQELMVTARQIRTVDLDTGSYILCPRRDCSSLAPPALPRVVCVVW